ncbi:heme-binding Shp domain-containing protein [Pseudoflavonifractor sp. SW1122]|uniref:heme-binding Shp domain-containing protein n=1 Tax=Pseudoflavonifractor sp. SW1122 TaxID=2530044 RepID=UPI001FAD06B6|nr:heme-binding Shp domain-containing protein [Pseudoflavonifractor sp. SW1122]
MPASAASHGIYTATATAHYRHPTTGVIEDSGGENSAVLGQSMTESATNKKALVEVDASGNTWITVRLNLMDNIQSPKFQVDGRSVSASLMQEDYGSNTADFRLKANSEKSIIRCNMYVTPMGREVIFYITVGNLKSGSGDFVTSISVEQPKATAAPAPSATKTPAAPATHTPEATVAPSATPEPSPTTDPEAQSSASGLEEFDASGNAVEETQAPENTDSSSGSPVLWWVIGGLVVIAAVGGGVWYVFFVRKGKHPFGKK